MKKTRPGVRILTLLSLLFSPCVLWASAEWSVTIDMTIINPQCTINNNKEILIDFEKVLINKIDGQEYKKKPIELNIACPGKNTANLRVQIVGETATFNIGDKLLKTDNPDLGVRILADNTTLPVSNWISFIWPQQVPNLAAVLVKRDSATLTGGQFNAGAVLNLAYN